ncbi:MAG: MFS transporter [Chloroflexi bacterium]|nr:MFS transporter [Chloroflexota bacterium]
MSVLSTSEDSDCGRRWAPIGRATVRESVLVSGSAGVGRRVHCQCVAARPSREEKLERPVARHEQPPSPEHDAPEPVAPQGPARIVGRLSRLPTFQALHYREFRLLWLGQFGVAMGMWMDQVARGWLMYQLTDSALQLGLVRVIQAVPFLLLSPLAGAFADRYDRKAQLIIAQSIDAVLYGLVAVLVLTGRIEPWHLYATALGTASLQVFQQPARQALVYEAVDRRHLTNAIGLDSMVFNVSRTTGPAVAGILITLFDPGGSYIAQAVLYVLATIWTIQLRPSVRSGATAAGKDGSHLSVVRGTIEGWQYILHHETVRVAILVAMVAALLAMPFSTLLPVFARDILGAGATGQGLLLTGMGIGALVSAVLIASIGDRLPRGTLMFGAAFIYGMALTAFAASGSFALSIALMVVAGLGNVGCHALVRTVVQSYAPSEMQGRMMAMFQQNQVVLTVGSLIAGALASVVGAPWTVGVMGSICAVAAVAIFLAVPHARRIR